MIVKQGEQDGTILFEGMNFSISKVAGEDEFHKAFFEHINKEKTLAKTIENKN